jgi:hypothetical protein
MRANRHLAAAERVALHFALVFAVAGCIGDAGPSRDPNDDQAAESGAPASDTPTATDPPATPDPSVQITSEPAESTSPSPEAAASGDASPDVAGSADACSGTDNNRDFFADAAAALDFDVYCPALPRGWFVDTGEYQLRNGGMLAITYHGPGGAVIDLLESGPCQEGDDCMPAGTEEGKAAFGDRPATIVAFDDGRLMVVAESVPDGQWSITATGLDEATLTAIAKDLVLVGG